MDQHSESIILKIRAADPTLAQQHILSPSEHDRLAAMHEGARPSFVTARTLLRAELGRYMGLLPAAVPLRQVGAGRVSIEGFEAGEPPFFSVSHTGAAEAGIAAVAVSEQTPVGVDVQQIDHAIDWRRVAERRLPAREWAMLSAMPAKEGRLLFFTLWAIKEACVKMEDGKLMPYLRGVELDFSKDKLELAAPTPGGARGIGIYYQYRPEFELAIACVSLTPVRVDLDCKIIRPTPKVDILKNNSIA